MTKLILIRHGQTDANVNKQYCGFNDPSLNSKGKLQAQQLENQLKDKKIDAFYSSDLVRAFETAQITFPNESIELIRYFREYNFGVFEGLTYEQIMVQYPNIYPAWINDPSKKSIPEGDSYITFSERVREGLKLLLEENCGKRIALVTHSGPIRLILSDALNYEPDMFWKIKQNNAVVNIINFNETATEVEMINSQSFEEYNKTN